MSTNHPLFVSAETSAYSSTKLPAFLLGANLGIATVGQVDGLVPREDPDKFSWSYGQRIMAAVAHHVIDNRMAVEPISGIKLDGLRKSLLAEDRLEGI